MSKSSKLSKNKRTETQKQNAQKRPAITAANKKRKFKKYIHRNPLDYQALERFKEKYLI